MNLTAHLLTKNNAETIEETLQSLQSIPCHIQITDLGSTDTTLQICQKHGLQARRLPFETDRSHVLNQSVERATTDWQLFIQPWETIILSEGWTLKAGRCLVIQNQIVSKEIRIWAKQDGFQFVNPIFEYVAGDCPNLSELMIRSSGRTPLEDDLVAITEWKRKSPTAPEPFYYETSVLMSLSRYEDFLKASEYYMFLEKKQSKSTTMNRYYYAMVQLLHKKKVKPVLQNINLCLCHNPLMAEFWCLIGDVYYHLLRQFPTAKEFYENAMILGSRRLQGDEWPMDISKYQDYPMRMIESCEQLLASRASYSSTHQ